MESLCMFLQKSLTAKCEYLEYNIYRFLAKINDIIGSGSWTWSKMSGLNSEHCICQKTTQGGFFKSHVQYQT